MGKRHPEPLPVRGHHHPGAHLRLPKASRYQKLSSNISINHGTTHLMSVLTEALRGQRAVEEEDVGLRVRRSGALRHRGQEPEVKTLPLMVRLSCSLLCFNFISRPA